ncbi:MAG: sulfatase-like hydrolase/transferase [Prevotellaceae bacterium]|jgi:phosphoglycerol transferase MdoB-like AlkP superfamily enzyme|nr:sulfatase-like hydrolase/transferase [Prevotellaceae bacterium]
MKKRFQYLLSLFGLILAIFVLQKPLFMLYNRTFSSSCSAGDYLTVILHGLKLDLTVTGYFMSIPWLGLLLCTLFHRMNPRKILLPYFIIIALFTAVVVVVDASLYSFWNFKLDAMALFYLDSPSGAMASVSSMFIILRIFAVLLLAGLYSWLFVKITPAAFPPVKTATGKLRGILAMVVVGFVLFAFIRGGFKESTANAGRVYFSDNQFLNHSAVNPVFSFVYSLNISEDFAKQFDFFPEDERRANFEGLYPKEGETCVRLLKTERPNIVIILLESFSGNFIEPLGGEPGVTPNINRLSEEGIFFTQFYSNSFRTDRGIVSTLSGYPGLPTTSVMKLPAKSRNLPSIAKSLGKAGYKSGFLYGGDIDFTNMKSYFWGTGYHKIVSDTDFTLKEQHTHAWGVNDDITFDYLYNEICERKDSLWHIGFLTLSSHEPFTVPYNRFENRIVNAFAYTDECAGRFIDKLKKTPTWDNLLIILLADHGYCYPAGTLTVREPDYFHTPMLWLGGAITQPLKVNKPVNQTDLAATLLGQLNLPHDDFAFSRDVFSSSYTYPFVFFSFNNGFGFKDSTGVSVYDNHPDKAILEQPEHSPERIKKGKTILQTLYDDLGNYEL